MTLALTIAALGMWLTYAGAYTAAMIFISSAHPFVANAITTVSSRWFGPKGRNLATGLMLASISLPVGIESIMDDNFEKSLTFPLPIITTVMILVSILFIYEMPDFSPTMSEEDKIEMKKLRPFNFTYLGQLKMLKYNKIYIFFALSAVLMMVNINEVNSILIIFYRYM